MSISNEHAKPYLAKIAKGANLSFPELRNGGSPFLNIEPPVNKKLTVNLQELRDNKVLMGVGKRSLSLFFFFCGAAGFAADKEEAQPEEQSPEKRKHLLDVLGIS